MIIGYKADANTTLEEQIRSLRDNVQLALNEQNMLIDQLQKSLLNAFGVDMSEIQSSITSFAEQMQQTTNALSDAVEGLVQSVQSLDERVTALEQTE